VTHDPAAPDVTDEITTLAASGAEVIILGTTGAPCPQAMAALAASSYDPMTIMSYTCEVIPSYFTPIDPAGEGVIVARTSKEPSRESDDPAMQAAMAALDAANLDPFTGAYYTGVIYGVTVEEIFRQAGEMEGGLNRVNLMRAVWNADTENALLVEGSTMKTDGANDAYLLEAAQFAAYVPPSPGEDVGRWENLGDLLNVEGQTGAYEE
jgi:hypothetical protein